MKQQDYPPIKPDRWYFVFTASTHIALRLLHGIAALVIIALVAVTLVSILIIVQSKRDEARPVDAIVVLQADRPERDTVEYALRLYWQRYAPRLVLVGNDLATVRTELLGKGVPERTVLLAESADAHQNHMLQVADIAYQHHIQSVLIVNIPEELLLDLKIAHDQGLLAYSSPPYTLKIYPQPLLQSSLNYWRYILLGPAR